VFTCIYIDCFDEPVKARTIVDSICPLGSDSESTLNTWPRNTNTWCDCI